MSVSLTIGIATYNGADRILRLLSTLADHVTQRDIRVVVCDDGSTDGTGTIVEGFWAKTGLSHAQVIHQPNIGPGQARNKIIDETRTDYLWFVDDDDEIPPWAMERVFGILEFYHPKMLNFTFRFDPISEWGAGKHVEPEEMSPREALSFIDSHTWASIYSVAFLRENDIRFPRLRIAEDVAFTFRSACAADKILFANEPLYRYAVRSGSLCGIDSVPVRLDAFREVSCIIDDLMSAYPEYRSALEYRRYLLWVSLGAALRAIRRQHGPSLAIGRGIRAVRAQLSQYRAAQHATMLSSVVQFLPRYDHPTIDFVWDILSYLKVAMHLAVNRPNQTIK